MMKILRIYSKLPPLPGGMEAHIKNLSICQMAYGHDVILAFNQGDKLRDSDIQIFKIMSLYKIKPQSLGILFFYFLLCIELMIHPIQRDLIHIHGDWSSLVFAPIIKRLTKARKIIYTCHGELNPTGSQIKLFHFFGKSIDVCFSTGYNSKEILQKTLNKDVILQPSGINNLYFRLGIQNPVEKKIISVSNLVSVKNIDLILSIADILKDYTFEIIGDGSEKKRLLQKIQICEIKNVILAGHQSPDYIHKKMLESSIFLQTSLKEGTSTSMMEAIATGMPVVVSNAGGVDAVIKNGSNGFIINSFDANDYADKIQWLTRDKDLWHSISSHNIQYGTRFSWNNVAQNITNVLTRN